ncbi:hypothetical protein D3C71_533040 [compost metagenome]
MEGLLFKSHNVSQDGVEESQLYSQRFQGRPPLTHLHTYTTFLPPCPLKVRFPSPAPIEFWSHVKRVLTGDVETEKTGLDGRFFCVWFSCERTRRKTSQYTKHVNPGLHKPIAAAPS